MVTPYLPSVDASIKELGSLGEDTSLRARSKRYADLGLDKRLGGFVGTPSQNQALVKAVRGEKETAGKLAPGTLSQFIASQTPNQPSSLSGFLTNLTSSFSPLFAGLKSPTVTQPGAIQTPAPTIKPTAPAPITPSTPYTPQPKPTVAEAVSALGATSAPAPTVQGVKAPETPSVTNAVPPQRQEITLSGGTKLVKDETGAIKTPAEVQDADTKNTVGYSASDVLPPNPDEMVLFNDFLNSQDFKNLKDSYDAKGLSAEVQAQNAKAELEARYASEKRQLEEQLGRNGLFMSGIRSTQVKALADNLATSQLGLDRTLASKLIDMNLDLREGVLKGVTELVKQAKDKNKDAIEQLNKVGLAVVGNKLVPTVESTREARLSETAGITAELNNAKFELSQAKTSAQLEIAQERLQLAIDKAGGENKSYDRAQEIIDANPDASYEQLRTQLLRLPGLSVTEVDALLTSQNIVKETVFTPEQLQGIGDAYVKANKGFFESTENARNETIQFIRDQGVVNINGKTVTLSKRQREEVATYLEGQQGKKKVHGLIFNRE